MGPPVTVCGPHACLVSALPVICMWVSFQHPETYKLHGDRVGTAWGPRAHRVGRKEPCAGRTLPAELTPAGRTRGSFLPLSPEARPALSREPSRDPSPEEPRLWPMGLSPGAVELHRHLWSPFLSFPGAGANRRAQRAAGLAASLPLRAAARDPGRRPSAPASSPTPEGRQPVRVLRPPAAPALPWHLSRAPTSCSQRTDGRRVWPQPLASVRSAGTSGLPLGAIAGQDGRMWSGQGPWPGPGRCTARAHASHTGTRLCHRRRAGRTRLPAGRAPSALLATLSPFPLHPRCTSLETH